VDRGPPPLLRARRLTAPAADQRSPHLAFRLHVPRGTRSSRPAPLQRHPVLRWRTSMARSRPTWTPGVFHVEHANSVLGPSRKGTTPELYSYGFHSSTDQDPPARSWRSDQRQGSLPWSDRSPGPGQAFTSHDRHGAPAPWASLPGGKAVRFVGQRRWPIDVPRGTTATLTPPSTKPQAPPQPQGPRCDGQDHLGTAAWASPQVAQPSRAAPTPSLPDHRPAKPDSSPRAAGTTSDTTSEHGPKLWSGCSTWNNSPTTMSFPIVDNPPSHSPGPLPPSQAWSPHHALEARERLSRQSRAAATTSRSPWRTGGELPADRQDPTQAGSAPPPTQRPTPPRRWRTPKDHKALWPWQIQIESLGAI